MYNLQYIFDITKAQNVPSKWSLYPWDPDNPLDPVIYGYLRCIENLLT